MDASKTAKTDESGKSVGTVINCLVKVVSGLYKSLADQGKQIKEIFEELSDEKKTRESLLGELQKRYEEMERKDREGIEDLVKEELEKTEKVLEKKVSEEIETRNVKNMEFINTYILEQSVKIEKHFDKKMDDLEKKCDEGRQREMKGTIIVSSPQRGRIATEATIRTQDWGDNNTHGPESELDMVLRMVYEKTGVWFPYSDVAACHQFGKAESHSFVLKIWNRNRFSSWDQLAQGMLTGKGFSDQNIFINFMLTPRRTELSKQVRQAKKDRLIAKYSVDQNGKFFVKMLGDDTRFHPVISVEDLEKLKKKS